ncbi:MAG: hypothetical protein H8E12_17130 [Rhodobacteraceae bacterium]|nr:hypothetical protein [Paracoccaceae bacterium]
MNWKKEKLTKLNDIRKFDKGVIKLSRQDVENILNAFEDANFLGTSKETAGELRGLKKRLTNLLNSSV